MKEKFLAQTQYGDYKGTISFDKRDAKLLSDFLEEGQIEETESIVGFTIYNGTESKETISVIFLIKKEDESLENEEVNLRKLHIDLPTLDFLKFFKRISIKASYRDILSGKEIVSSE